MTTNVEMDDIIKIVNSLKESRLLIKVLVKQLKMKQKKKRWISQHIIR